MQRFCQFINIFCGISKKIQIYRATMTILESKSSTSNETHFTQKGKLHQLPQEFQSVGVDCLK